MTVEAVKLCRNGLHRMTPDNVRLIRAGTSRETRVCRECERARDRVRYVRDREKRNAAGRAWHARQSERDKRAARLRKFGITPEDYDGMLAAQGGGCAICGSTEPGGRWGTHFHVDHCHESGRVRGLLCGNCNVLLGHAQDDPGRLTEAARYLELGGGKS